MYWDGQRIGKTLPTRKSTGRFKGAKVQAMSSEAKASASVLGSLPFIVTTLVYLTSPAYIQLLWSTMTGNFVVMCGLGWMFCGIMVMKKMINFKF